MAGKATVPIYHGDDFERMAELRREVDIAERKYTVAKMEAEGSTEVLRAGDDVAAVTEARARVEAARELFASFVDEATERAEMWVLRPLGHEAFRDLLKAHPPRMVKKADDEGVETETVDAADAYWKVNTETFPKALLTFVDPEDEDHRTIEAPFESVGALQKRVKRLSAGEFETMWVYAHTLNKGGAADPKASPYYDGTPRSAET